MTEAVRMVGPERVPANVVCELELTAARDHDDPWSEIELDVEFSDPDGRMLTVPAYWQQVIKGVLIVVAVAVDMWSRRQRAG